MNILILRVSAIGDVIHTMPALLLLRKLYPNANIGWVVQKKASYILENHPLLNNLYVLPDRYLNLKNWKQTYKVVKDIRKTHWNAILDFQGIVKTSIISHFIKGARYGFNFKNTRGWGMSLINKYKIDTTYTNIIQKNLSLADNIDLRNYAIKNNQINPKYINSTPTINVLNQYRTVNIPDTVKSSLDEWFNKNNVKRFIAIAPNTTWNSKLWPTQYWEDTVRTLAKEHTILLLGKDFGIYAKNLYDRISQYVLCPPETNLTSTAYIIHKSDLLIAPDTGLLHLADFLNKKALGIFGPTLATKHGPFLNATNVKHCIQIPCPHYYAKNHASYNCMLNFKPDQLVNKVMLLTSDQTDL